MCRLRNRFVYILAAILSFWLIHYQLNNGLTNYIFVIKKILYGTKENFKKGVNFSWKLFPKWRL